MAAWPGLRTAQATELHPDELVEAAAGVELEVDVLSAGAAASRLSCVRSAARWGVDVLEVNAHIRAAGGFDPGCVSLLVVETPGEAMICGRRLDRTRLLVLPGGTEIAASIKPGLSYTAVVVPEAHWRAALPERRRVADAYDLAPTAAALATRTARAITRRLAAAGDAPQDLPAALADLVHELAALGPGSGTPAVDRDPRTRVRQAWAVHDRFRAGLGEDISIAGLCRELGTSRRQLEYAVRSVFDTSPQALLQAMRLNESRRRLMTARAAGRTVTEIAMDLGITHLGRYATRYRRMFGETPRQTLLRGRRA